MKTLSQSRISRKQVVCIILAILIFCTTISSLFPSAYADKKGRGQSYSTYKSDLEGHAGDAKAMTTLAFDMLCMAYGCHPDMNFTKIAGEIYKFSSFKGTFPPAENNAMQALIGNSFTLLDAAKAMYNVFKVVGIALILLFFLIEIMDEVQADNFNVEHLVKKLITLTIAILVMNQGGELFKLLAQLGDALVDDAASAAAAGDAGLFRAYEQIYDGANFGGNQGLFSLIKIVFSLIGIILQNVITFLLMAVVLLVAYLTAYSRFIEFLVRFAFAPVGISQLVSGGSKGPGMRYIKKFASVCVQGAISALAFGTVSIIQQQSTITTGMFGQFILPITLLGFLFRIKQIADDVVGV